MTKEMPRYINRELARTITQLLDDNPILYNAVTRTLTSIQNAINIPQLPVDLRRQMSGWARTGWYHIDGEAKFEHCLRKIVTKELKRRVFLYLIEVMTDNDPLPDDHDLSDALGVVRSPLALGNWTTMDNHTMISELCREVSQWIKNHNEQLPQDVGDTFQWKDNETGEVYYHLPHLPKPVVSNPVVACVIN